MRFVGRAQEVYRSFLTIPRRCSRSLPPPIVDFDGAFALNGDRFQLFRLDLDISSGLRIAALRGSSGCVGSGASQPGGDGVTMNLSNHIAMLQCDAPAFQTSKKGVKFQVLTFQGGKHVQLEIAGLAYRDDASLDGLRSVSSRLCRRRQVLCAIKRGNSRRTP